MWNIFFIFQSFLSLFHTVSSDYLAFYQFLKGQQQETILKSISQKICQLLT